MSVTANGCDAPKSWYNLIQDWLKKYCPEWMISVERGTIENRRHYHAVFWMTDADNRSDPSIAAIKKDLRELLKEHTQNGFKICIKRATNVVGAKGYASKESGMSHFLATDHEGNTESNSTVFQDMGEEYVKENMVRYNLELNNII